MLLLFCRIERRGLIGQNKFAFTNLFENKVLRLYIDFAVQMK